MSSELEFLDQRRNALLAEVRSIDERRQQLLTQEKEEPDQEIPQMLTIKKAAETVGLAYDHVRQLCLQDKIVYIKAGSKYLINMGTLYRYLNKGEGCVQPEVRFR